MGSVVQLRSGDRLTEIEESVYETIDRMCFHVGELLHEAQSICGPKFKTWVVKHMPFGYETARRLIAIHLAYRELPAEKLAQLPRPWQALYALAPHSRGKVLKALESGEIGTSTTVREAREIARRWSNKGGVPLPVEERYGPADNRASALMAHSPAELNPYVRDALARWLTPEPS